MVKVWWIIIFFCLYINLLPLSWAEDIGLADERIIKSLTKLETEQENLNKYLEAQFKNINENIGNLNGSLNERIDDLKDDITNINNNIFAMNNNLNERIDAIWLAIISGFVIILANIWGFFLYYTRGRPIKSPRSKLKEEPVDNTTEGYAGAT